MSIGFALGDSGVARFISRLEGRASPVVRGVGPTAVAAGCGGGRLFSAEGTRMCPPATHAAKITVTMAGTMAEALAAVALNGAAGTSVTPNLYFAVEGPRYFVNFGWW
jgi:hypothetical protein